MTHESKFSDFVNRPTAEMIMSPKYSWADKELFFKQCVLIPADNLECFIKRFKISFNSGTKYFKTSYVNFNSMLLGEPSRMLSIGNQIE